MTGSRPSRRPPNNGWVLVDGGNDACRVDTSEASAGGDRPRLQVNFRTDVVGLVPEPTALVMFSALRLLVSRRQRG